MKKLNLGSGKARLDGWVNTDIANLPGVDVVFDMEEGFPFDDNTFDEVQAIHCLEHVNFSKKVFVIEEIWRVCVHGAKIYINVPNCFHYNCWCDPTHKSAWHIGNMFYFSDQEGNFQYYSKAKFHIDKQEVCGPNDSDIKWWLTVLKK